MENESQVRGDVGRGWGRPRRPRERTAGEIVRETGVTGGMPDDRIASGGTLPPVGPSGATDSGEEDLRGEYDAEA